jgi:DNA polymerase
MKILSLDFETRSVVDLRRTGVYPYAEHPHTDVWCCAYAVDDGEVCMWTPDRPVPDVFRLAVEQKAEFRAWNAQFERVIWEKICVPRYGFPPVPMELWHDTAAEAAALALPRSLGHAADVLNVEMQKDKQGHALMLRMARPRTMKGKHPIWWNDQEKLDRLMEYCEQDVRVERAIYQKIPRLPPAEREVYLLDQRINDRGVQIDTLLVESAREISERGIEEANDAISQLTSGEVEAVTKAADLKRWLQYKGLDVEDVRKATVRNLLSTEVGGEIRQVLEIRADAARTSVAKLDAMMVARCEDDRLRGTLLYHGASTGRWAGKLVQPQNLPRGEIPEVEQYIPLVLDRDYDALNLIHPPLVVISSMLRQMFRADAGYELFAADFSAIEARVVAWLAGEEALLAGFRSGKDVYREFASSAYQMPVEQIAKDSPERQLGKATVLGCGFGMGGSKFQRSAYDQYGLTLTLDKAKETVGLYRSLYPNIPRLWRKLEGLALRALREPNKVHTGGFEGQLKFKKVKGFLMVGLPAHRWIAYPRPRIETVTTPWNEEKQAVVAWGTNSYTRRWEERSLYGGLLTENVVQAVARDIMAASMLRVERNGYPVVMTVHDEVVCEVPVGGRDYTERCFAQFLKLMAQAPEWASTCPLAVEGWHGERYRK